MDGATVSAGRRHVSANRPNRRVQSTADRGLRAAALPDDAPVAVPSLRWILLGLDVCAVTLAWFITLLVPGVFSGSMSHTPSQFLIELAVITAASILVIASQHLYLARVCGVRAVETARLARASLLAGVIAFVVGAQLATELSIERAVLGGVLTFAFLTIARGVYGSWLRRGRTNGRFCRPIVLVGAGPEAAELYRLLDHHPELGFRVTGVVGPAPELRDWSSKVALGGDFEDILPVLERARANGVIVATSDVPSDELNRMTRVLLRHNVHVHLSSGLRGIDHRRIRSLPLAHEPLYYLEQQSFAPWQRCVKRILDVAVSGLMLVLLSPIFLASAIAVKLGDRGPVFFRQTRIGRDGVPFTLLKLRTMVTDAEEQLVDLTIDNQRTGPLFKLERDPRRTPVGRILERTSIDELPQLINVLRGEMSLVGPAARAASRGRAVRRRAPRSPRRDARDHRSLAGGGPRQPRVRGLPSARPLLRRELVGRSRPRHHAGDGAGRARPPDPHPASPSRRATVRRPHSALWRVGRHFVNPLPGNWSDAVVYCAGTPWAGNRGTDQHIAERLARDVPVIYVDPPSWRGHFPSVDPGHLELAAPGLAILSPYGVPGLERPFLHRLNDHRTRRAIASAIATLQGSARVLVLACCRGLFGAADEQLSVFSGTDDFVAGAELMGIPEARLRRQETRNLEAAAVVVAVSEHLAEKWRAPGHAVAVIPNGVDDELFAGVDALPFPADVELTGPIVGLVGHLSNRIDIELLEALAVRDLALLLVGPRQASFETDRIDRLIARPNVQWVGAKPFAELPSYLRAIDVGITPYPDTPFNRGSFPLKTLEYLAAGRDVVATDLPSVRALDTDLIRIASDRDQFVAQVGAALAAPRTDELVRARRAFAHEHSWDVRAEEFARLLGVRTASPAA